MNHALKGMLDSGSPIMVFLTRIFDLMLLNLLTLACALPVVTAGASLTALHYCLLRLARGEEIPVLRSFFHSFRGNILQAAGVFCILLAGLILLFRAAFLLSAAALTGIRTICAFVLCASAVVWLMLFLYAFPLLARYESATAEVFRSSLAVAVVKLPRTAGMLAVLLFFWCGGFLLPLEISAPFGMLFGLSLPFYLCAKLYSPIFVHLEE